MLTVPSMPGRRGGIPTRDNTTVESQATQTLKANLDQGYAQKTPEQLKSSYQRLFNLFGGPPTASQVQQVVFDGDSSVVLEEDAGLVLEEAWVKGLLQFQLRNPQAVSIQLSNRLDEFTGVGTHRGSCS